MSQRFIVRENYKKTTTLTVDKTLEIISDVQNFFSYNQIEFNEQPKDIAKDWDYAIYEFTNQHDMNFFMLHFDKWFFVDMQ